MRLLPALCLLTFPVLAQTTRYRDLVFAAYDRNTAIAYGSAVNRFTHQTETLLLDLYQPRGDTDGSRPAIVVVHGGGFVGGSRGASQMVQLGADLARRGYVARSIDYRLAPSGNPITAQVIEDAGHDCKAAVRWLRANAASLRLDQGRIAAIP
ncbi:MAG: alpha/beta hydrolase, partial [Planctomycetes bacterium]|nr:alpha/beta hydrolase [Planctomycetota bacterium]